MRWEAVDFAPGENTYGLKIFKETWLNIAKRQEEVHWKYGLPDGVQVMGFTPDKKVVAIEELYFEKGTKLHLIGGTIEKYEPAQCTARRELLEETGYESEVWIPLSIILENSKKSNRRIHFYLALDCRKVQEGESDIKTVLMNPKDFWCKLMDYFKENPEEEKVAGNSLKLMALAYAHLGLIQIVA